MSNQQASWQHHYHKQGYGVVRAYFSAADIASLKKVILKFHTLWKQENPELYQDDGFNSSLITGSEYLGANDRQTLFNMIGSPKIMDIVTSVITGEPAFMNTQLFFDPCNSEQKNFWHRDCQYDFDVEGQKKVIHETQVLHIRIPLFDEPGMELVPGSHKRWDTEEEMDVRLERKKRSSSEALSTGKTIALSAGDVLFFSADMIHRGLYGQGRLAFDILVFDSAGDYIDYVDDDCLPSNAMLQSIADPRLFTTTLALKAKAQHLAAV
ncbi:phytanoyl-CoA dioxygenase family protein [Marinagarivorans algicola]|uniref:phytanoyl-CoA dioxygenase family protein n=1 Tax=Marinagarivorans algicola TaxID=1513270 RepID=UPI0006B5F686|nr:phytanoyl-CoA dioxygenase family protein [Marinagarivorans algicola]